MRPRTSRLKRLIGGSILVLAAMVAAPANAQGYPSRPLKLIVPLGAGGASDLNARVLAEKLSERLGQPVVVENRPGAEGIIGVDAAAKSAPDGYTLVLGSSTTLAANYSLRAKLPFDPVADFSPVSMAFKNAFNILVIHPDVPAKNVRELIAYARTRPGQLNYSTAGSGSGFRSAAALWSASAEPSRPCPPSREAERFSGFSCQRRQTKASLVKRTPIRLF